MSTKRLICPWCDEAPLQLVKVRHDAPNAAGSAALAGVALVCSARAGCPDTTGACSDEAEATGFALELGCAAWSSTPSQEA